MLAAEKRQKKIKKSQKKSKALDQNKKIGDTVTGCDKIRRLELDKSSKRVILVLEYNS